MGSPVRVGIIGVGASGSMHAAGLRDVEEGKLVACADVDRPRVEAFARKWEIPAAYDSIEALLADPEIDVVHLCTPPFLHEPQALAAVAARKHVLVEKPIARTTAEADRMIEAAERAGVILGGIFQKRFIPLPRQVKDALDKGSLGQLYLVDGYVKWWRDDEYYRAASWRGTREFEGGGAMINQAIHTIDLLLWLGGPIVEVSGRVGTLAHPIEMEDVAVAHIQFASGALGVLEATTAAWPGFAERIELHGEGGSIVLNEGEGAIEWKLKGESERRTTSDEERGTGAADPLAISLAGHPAQFRDFYRAIREGRRPGVDGREAKRALEVIQAIQRSSATRQPVALG